MKKNSQSFGSFFLNAARVSGSTILIRLILAVILAGVCACVTLLLPSFLPSIAGRFPEYLFSGSFGAAHVFCVIATVVIIVYRLFANKLFIFDEILSGKWELASRCGADLKTPCLAKALFAFWAPVSTYCISAVLYCLLVSLLGSGDFSGLGGQMSIFLIGLLTLIVMISIELIFAALGVQKSVLPFLCLPFFIVTMVLWYWKGFLSFSGEETVKAGIDGLLSFSPAGLLLIAPVLMIIALVVAMIVPAKRIDRYVIEDLDDEMLGLLEFREDQEVYEKTGEGFELIFTGKEVLKNR